MKKLYFFKKWCTLLIGLSLGLVASAQTEIIQDGIRFTLKADGTAEAGEVVTITNYENSGTDDEPWTPVDGEFTIVVPPYVYDADGTCHTVTAIGDQFSWTDTLYRASTICFPSTLKQVDATFLSSHSCYVIVCGALEPPAIVNPHRCPPGMKLYVPSESVNTYRSSESDWGPYSTMRVSYGNVMPMYTYATQAQADGTLAITSLANFRPSFISDVVFPDQIDGTAVTKISGNIPALSVTVPEGVTQYAGSISYGTIEVRLPSTVKALPKYSFYAYPYNGIRSRLLERVFLSEGLDSIGEGAFSHCDHLKQLRIPSTVSFIGDGQSCLHALEAFDVDERNAYYVSRDGVLFTRDLTTLQQYPSGKTDIAYTVPEGVKTIAAWSLEDARNLRSLRLPTTLDSIGDYAFNLDTLLTDIHFTTAEPPSVGRMFYSDTEHVDEFYARCKLFVPIGAAAAYEQNATLARFSQVAEEQVDAVEAISAAAPVPVVDYDLSGRRVKSGHGLIIRRMSDGTTHKLYRSRKH